MAFDDISLRQELAFLPARLATRQGSQVRWFEITEDIVPGWNDGAPGKPLMNDGGIVSPGTDYNTGGSFIYGALLPGFCWAGSRVLCHKMQGAWYAVGPTHTVTQAVLGGDMHSIDSGGAGAGISGCKLLKPNSSASGDRYASTGINMQVVYPIPFDGTLKGNSRISVALQIYFDAGDLKSFCLMLDYDCTKIV